MKLIAKKENKYDVDVAALFKKKNINHTMLEPKYIANDRAFELWWYSLNDKNHILAKHLFSPYYLFYILIEDHEVFGPLDFDYFMKNGEFANGGSGLGARDFNGYR